MIITTLKFVLDNKIEDYKLPDKLDIEIGDRVLVDNSQTKEVAWVINIYEAADFKNVKGEGAIERVIDEKDANIIKENKKKAVILIPRCEEIAYNLALPMQILDADFSFDEKKLTIYFSSEKRVDFRKLVGEYVKEFKKLIRLQQVGAREQAQKIGGYGKCGQEICCKRFLQNLDNVSIDCAKAQNLAEVSGNKINGNCGKLLCCLKYENDLYVETKKQLPPIGTEVKTKKGKGVVIKQNILMKKVYVEIRDAKGTREIIEVHL